MEDERAEIGKALALEHTRACLAICDEVIAEVEYTYVLGVPDEQRRLYREGLEARSLAAHLATSIATVDAGLVSVEMSQMEMATRQALHAFLTVENALFPERQERTMPAAPGARAISDLLPQHGRAGWQRWRIILGTGFIIGTVALILLVIAGADSLWDLVVAAVFMALGVAFADIFLP